MLNIYRASAGSGKTYSLTKDYIRLLFEQKSERAHRRILAVTFTNKATDEMKKRILKELHILAQGLSSDYRADLMTEFRLSGEAVDVKAKKILTTILHDYSSFSISTIDRFFQQVIRSFARDIGVNGGYNLELDNSQTLEQAIDNLYLDLSKEENRQLLDWLTNYAEERVEQSDSWNTRGSITELGQEIFRESYQYKAEDTNRKLHDREFLTNYRRSLRSIKTDFEKTVKETAAEGLNLISAHGLSTENFKGGSRSAMKTLEKLAKGYFSPSASFLSLADDVTNCYTKTSPRDIISAIETVYNTGLQQRLRKLTELFTIDIVNYNSALMVLKHINTLGILSDLAVQIKKLTDEQNSMLISDSNMLLNKIIDNSDTPFVYEKTGIHIDNYMIDEFQDTSVLQWKNFKPLIENSLSAGRFNLVVGDVKQSIYRWRNSDWKLLDEKIKDEFRTEQLKDKNLDTNWRSDRNIIAFNNAFFQQAADILQQKMNAGLESVIPLYPSLEPLTGRIRHAYSNVYQKVSSKALEGRVDFRFIDADENDEGWKAGSLLRLPEILEDLQSRGYRPADIAILVRTNKEEQDVIQKLLTYKTSPEAKSEFCYDIMGNEGLVIGSAASVRFILGIMQLFVNPADSIQQTIVNYEYARGMRGLSENEALNVCFSTQKAKESDLSALFSPNENERLKHLQHSSLFDMVEELIGLFGVGNWHNEAVFVQAFQDVVFRYTTGKTADLNSFLSWWKKNGERQCISTPDTQSAMRIMTVHKSKGLDFEVVIIPFCDWELDKAKGNKKSYLWCEPAVSPFDELPLMPVEYNKQLEKTIFAKEYYDEMMHRFIDNLNIAYVAFTRAKHEMICLAPAPKKEIEGLDKVNSMSALLISCFSADSLSTADQFIRLKNSFKDNAFSLGVPTIPIHKDTEYLSGNERIIHYPSTKSNERLRVKHQNLDFMLENQQLTDSRLNYGLIMHDILKQMITKSDQEKAVASMIREGRISLEESKTIETEMHKFWNLPETEAWFSDNVVVLNETTILTPAGEQYRPDRVILRDKEALIIDYKFGDTEKSSYQKQVKQYMNLIEEMGYNSRGFICYVSLGKVMHID